MGNGNGRDFDNTWMQPQPRNDDITIEYNGPHVYPDFTVGNLHGFDMCVCVCVFEV
jgi:hypothetical protein